MDPLKSICRADSENCWSRSSRVWGVSQLPLTKLLSQHKVMVMSHIQPESSLNYNENLATSCKAEISNSSGFMFKLLEETKPSNEDTFL